MELSQLCAANYHYKRYTLDYFLDSAERLGYQSIELWASGPHLHLEDFDAGRLRELNRSIKKHHLNTACFTPEQCVYAVSVSHPDKRYRDRTVDFFIKHIEAAVCLECSCMVVSTGFAYLDVDAEEAFKWTADAFLQISRKAEQEGVTLALEPFTKYTTHICNEAGQLLRLLRAVGSPVLKGLADTDVIATTGVDTFETFIGILGRENLAHVHFVDGSPGGHLVPGDGNLYLDQALQYLEAMDYRGYLGLEILDRRYVMNPEDAMKRALAWYSERIG
ncbi:MULTISPECIES: sugar phosphate isomerase/epimerase family protein [unclassified Clostridium]|uniref:sugar phosphate isomerase/epimerase family protein n=1 Tax=unclassified Clostridium TaxID=2614128 RepID=UPI001105BD8C|nr:MULTISPECIES: sugar phosphate isomerase/epimerase family protein [unclassified Clostridium]